MGHEAGDDLRLLAILSLCLAITTTIAGPSAFAQQADQPASQVDDSPFGDLLEGLDESSEANKDAAGIGDDATASDTAELDGSGSLEASDQAMPLFLAQRAMGEAARLLAEDQLSEPTQSAQQQALDALDAFIEQALAASGEPSPPEQQASQQQNGDQPQQADASAQEGDDQDESDEEPSDSSGDQSGMAAGQPGQAPEISVDDVADPLSQPMNSAVWGHLPERLRERLQATLPEEFLPSYEQAIRDYFTRLSEMEDADDD